MTADGRSARTLRTVADFMSREVVTISPDASVRELAGLLVRTGVSGVPVVDRAGDVVGTVSITDILWLSDRLVPALAGEAGREPRGLSSVDLGTVGEIMTPDVFGLEPTASLRELLEFFAGTGLHRAPVVEGRKLVGIVSASDLLELIAGEGEAGG